MSFRNKEKCIGGQAFDSGVRGRDDDIDGDTVIGKRKDMPGCQTISG